jgi:hypothetical protein
MDGGNETLRWPTNLDRPAIEKRLAHVRDVAEKEGLPDVAALLKDIEGKSPAHIAKAVTAALALLEGKSELQALTLQLGMVALNLKNLR